MAVKWQVRNLALRFMNFLLHLKKKRHFRKDEGGEE